MKMLASLLLSTLILVVSASVGAQNNSAGAQDDTIIYKETGPNGAPVFTDQPTPNATQKKLAPANIIAPPANIPAAKNNPAAVNNYSISLSVNPDKQPDVGLAVSVSVNPALQRGMSVEILVDGGSYANGAQTQFTLIGLNSGTRNLQAILKQGNRELARSAITPTEVQRLGGTRKRN
jgi:hypothetical protein